MAVLTLDYRCCDRKRPLYIKHIEVERIAATARQQLVADSIDAVSFDALRQISGLKINGIDFALEVSTDYAVHDEQGNHVFGVCEFDPAMPDAAMVSISPVGESLSELLALSTLAHELGHAVFDAPGWVVQGSKGPGLFDDIEPTMQRAYRTTTPDSDHLSKSLSAKPTTEEHFAELRANEFMGSLLVPRQRIIAAVEEPGWDCRGCAGPDGGRCADHRSRCGAPAGHLGSGRYRATDRGDPAPAGAGRDGDHRAGCFCRSGWQSLRPGNHQP